MTRGFRTPTARERRVLDDGLAELQRLLPGIAWRRRGYQLVGDIGTAGGEVWEELRIPLLVIARGLVKADTQTGWTGGIANGPMVDAPTMDAFVPKLRALVQRSLVAALARAEIQLGRDDTRPHGHLFGLLRLDVPGIGTVCLLSKAMRSLEAGTWTLDALTASLTQNAAKWERLLAAATKRYVHVLTDERLLFVRRHGAEMRIGDITRPGDLWTTPAARILDWEGLDAATLERTLRDHLPEIRAAVEAAQPTEGRSS